ncbi:tripartite tricarboxylate transporter substrate binding protein [Ramlibacter sp. AN1015]|uniref:tripartite tricarboxylate transporter substrate binding protein n=1 Tax=Ramlibacter sp. AN1015 TaxID=3133428 RepID=UPI0030C12737
MPKTLLIAACAAALAWSAPAAQAQAAYPDRPIKLLVGFPPGGSTDLAGRILANRLSQSMGQTVLVENKAGASGNIAAESVARAAPDGYTLLMAATSFAAAPAFFDKLNWDPVKDFSPVSLVATVPIMAVTTPSLGVKNLKDLVAHSKANPGKLNLASPGPTTLTRLSGEQFEQAAGLDWTTVHYKGGAPAMQDLLAGRAHVMFANISDVIAQVKAGKLDAVAVATPTRTAIAPEVPTIAESGYPGFSFSTWQAVVGPAGMPPEVVNKLNAEIRKAMALPEVKEQFLKLGTDAATGSPQELQSLLVDEVAKIRKVAKAVGATSN